MGRRLGLLIDAGGFTEASRCSFASAALPAVSEREAAETCLADVIVVHAAVRVEQDLGVALGVRIVGGVEFGLRDVGEHSPLRVFGQQGGRFVQQAEFFGRVVGALGPHADGVRQGRTPRIRRRSQLTRAAQPFFGESLQIVVAKSDGERKDEEVIVG